MPLTTNPATIELRGEPVVVAAGLAVAYGQRTIWSNGDFAIPRGSFTAVLGPNGSGKSTLFKVLLGQIPAGEGRVTVFGASPRRGDARIGYIPQSSTFDPDFSIRGRDFVGLGVDGDRWGIPIGSGQKKDERIDQAIQAVSGDAYAGRPMGRLSGGEQQRLLLAHALAGEPELLLMDEPLSHLDVRNQGAIVQVIAKVVRERALTVLLIAHDVNPLLPYIDSVLYIANGRTATGPPSEIITSASLSAIYSAPIDVLTDRMGRLFVTGLEEEAHHPHA